MSQIEVDKVIPQSGTALQVGESGDTITIPSGATITNNGTATGFDTDTNDKVKVSANDTTPGFLNGKLVAGTNISLTEGTDGGNETLTAALTGTIATAQIADANVTTAKIADNAVTLAKMASGTDGNIISYDASGNPVAVATGSAGQVLTSAGAGAVPTFADAAGGIEMADQYRITANKSGNGQLNSNWERSDTLNAGFIGTGMTESSGVFSFPSTGIYFITAGSYILASNSYTYGGFQIQVTTDNSSYTTATEAYTTGWTHGIELGVFVQYIFDVTNTSNDKFRINARAVSNNCTFQGSTSSNKTWVSAIRLGDT